MSNLKNISIDAIERKNDQEWQHNVKTNTFNTKNYLNVKLDKGQDEKKIYIRLLTVDKDSNSPFKHIKMHNCHVPSAISGNGFKSYVCLHHTKGAYTEELGDKCPFCEKRNEYYQMYDKYKKEGNDELAKEWAKKSGDLRPVEACVIRCIERGKEDEGVKFWKFNLRSDKLDPESQIIKLYKDKKEECEAENRPVENILDLDEGYDLKVTIQRKYTKDNKPTDKTTVSVSLFGRPKPLSEDIELRNKWINDEKVWSDVFVAKPYDYLKLILDGEIPWFDNKTNKWVKKDGGKEFNQSEYNEFESENSTKEGNNGEVKNVSVETPKVNEVGKTEKPNITFDDDDLPF